MKLYQIVVFIITNLNIIYGEDVYQSSKNEDLQNISLNEGEYFPPKQELIDYNSEFGHNLKSNKQNIFPVPSDFMIIKRTGEVSTPTKVLFAYPSTVKQPPSLSYATIHQTKIMPVKVIKEGPVKHVYLPENYNEQSMSLRSPKVFSGYQPTQNQVNFIKPAQRYTSVDYGSDQGVYRNGIYLSTNGYRIDAPKLNTNYASQYINRYTNGFENNIYASGVPYVSQNVINPDYSSFGTLPNQHNVYSPQQIHQFVNNRYLQNIPTQYNPIPSPYGQSQAFIPSTGSQQINTNRQAKFTNLDSELSNIVNDVLNKGQGYPTHDGFTMIKSKTDNAIYLIGKPGMSLNTIPNFSAYNYDSFQKPKESGSDKNEQTEKKSP